MGGSFVSRLRAKLGSGLAPVCIGFDPRPEALPAGLLPDAPMAERIATFCREVLPAVAPHTPAVKPNVAFFERYGSAGLAAYEDLCRRARDLDLLVIGDVKRGDIGATAAAYAEFHLDVADAVTLHPFLGRDSLDPFLRRCAGGERAVFILVLTSNPGAAEFQGQRLASGESVSDLIARQVAVWGEALGDPNDYGPVGAVVGATHPEDLVRLRRTMPRALLLIPGVGAQGGTVHDAAAAFARDGMGGLVNQSRGVLQCFAPSDKTWLAKVADAAAAFARAMAAALRARDGESPQGSR
jgi:orotidine-5'-phosphate decarboxylase